MLTLQLQSPAEHVASAPLTAPSPPVFIPELCSELLSPHPAPLPSLPLFPSGPWRPLLLLPLPTPLPGPLPVIPPTSFPWTPLLLPPPPSDTLELRPLEADLPWPPPLPQLPLSTLLLWLSSIRLPPLFLPPPSSGTLPLRPPPWRPLMLLPPPQPVTSLLLRSPLLALSVPCAAVPLPDIPLVPPPVFPLVSPAVAPLVPPLVPSRRAPLP